jgi:hypothetical protein
VPASSIPNGEEDQAVRMLRRSNSQAANKVTAPIAMSAPISQR